MPRCGDRAHRRRLVVRDGFFGVAPRRRQRYRCFNPADRADFHRFTPAVPRVETGSHRCLDCQNPLSVGTGPVAARRYDYIAREVAAALVSLSHGSTYQAASEAARESVLAELEAAHAAKWWQDRTMRHGQLAADWVGVFTDVVLAGTEESAWPEVVLLDSTSFWRQSQGGRVTAFHVLTAYGYAEGSVRGRLVKAVASKRSNVAVWLEFLGSMPGQPQVVVADGAPELRAAVRSTWPSRPERVGPEFVSCRWHWAKNLRAALEADLVALDTRHVQPATKRDDARKAFLYTSAERAFDSWASWQAYNTLAHNTLAYRGAGQLPLTLAWLRHHDLQVMVQTARRSVRPGPETVGPLEADIVFLRQHLASRAQSLRNRERTNQMLRLIVAGRRGQANERVWAERIRSYLEATAGIPAQQRRLAEAGQERRATTL